MHTKACAQFNIRNQLKHNGKQMKNFDSLSIFRYSLSLTIEFDYVRLLSFNRFGNCIFVLCIENVEYICCRHNVSGDRIAQSVMIRSLRYFVCQKHSRTHAHIKHIFMLLFASNNERKINHSIGIPDFIIRFLSRKFTLLLLFLL